MRPEILERYVEKVYGYAVKRTYSNEEAEELSQEILLAAVRELPKLREEERFEPWLWGLAKNVTRTFRRTLGKRRELYAYDTLEIPCEDEYFDEQAELYDALRTKIAMLSAAYRDVVVLHYYDGLSTKDISDRLGIPEGTVRWRLSEARNKLKKECMEMEETALRPVKLRLDIYGVRNYGGNIPFPTVYVEDALSQNILCGCYDSPKSVEELAKLCGVPAYYVEDRLQNMLKREAVVEVGGKYRTDFVIYDDRYGKFCEENGEKQLRPLLQDLTDALKRVAEDAGQLGLYTAERSDADLFYLYGAMAFSHLDAKYGTLPYPPIPKRYDGNPWCYLGITETGKYRRIGIGTQCNANRGSRGSCSHTVFFMSGFAWRGMMVDRCINVCEDILCKGGTEDVRSAADAIRDGYIRRREDGSLLVTIPFFTNEQYVRFGGIVENRLAPLMPAYNEMLDRFVAGYKALFPRHLSDDADRMCRGLFMGMYHEIARHIQRTGAVPPPSPGCVCDVIVQHKKPEN